MHHGSRRRNPVRRVARRAPPTRGEECRGTPRSARAAIPAPPSSIRPFVRDATDLVHPPPSRHRSDDRCHACAGNRDAVPMPGPDVRGSVPEFSQEVEYHTSVRHHDQSLIGLALGELLQGGREAPAGSPRRLATRRGEVTLALGPRPRDPEFFVRQHLADELSFDKAGVERRLEPRRTRDGIRRLTSANHRTRVQRCRALPRHSFGQERCVFAAPAGESYVCGAW